MFIDNFNKNLLNLLKTNTITKSEINPLQPKHNDNEVHIMYMYSNITTVRIDHD